MLTADREISSSSDRQCLQEINWTC